MNQKVVAVIVSYYPNMEMLQALLKSIAFQVANIVLVDNGSLSGSELKTLPVDVIVRSLNKNMGLGIAQNEGIAIAKELGAGFVLILDQDSMPSSIMVKELLNGFMYIGKKSSVAAVGANYNAGYSPFVKLSGLSLKRVECLPNEIIEVDHLISSGCLISINAISIIGLMKEDLFIDHVDTEWSIRAKANGFTMWGVGAAVMEHRLGEQMITVFGRKIPLHKSFRYYYIVRNGMQLVFSKDIPLRWRLVMLIRTLKVAFLFSVFPKDRFNNMKMIMIGFKDALIGISGKLKSL